MPRWPRPPNLLRLFVGQHIVNGLSVGVGVIAIALVASAVFGFAAGQPATLGAISASISDLPAPWREKARTMGFGFALALLSTVAIQLALPWPLAALLMIGVISFVGGLVTGLGRWAVAVGMQAVIPMVFILGFPRETLPAAVRIETLFAAGGVSLHRVCAVGDGVYRRQRPAPGRLRNRSANSRSICARSLAYLIPARISRPPTGRRSASRRRLPSNCSRRALFCSTGQEIGESVCALPPRSASCSTRSTRWSPRNATSRSSERRRRRDRCLHESARPCASARSISST